MGVGRCECRDNGENGLSFSHSQHFTIYDLFRELDFEMTVQAAPVHHVHHIELIRQLWGGLTTYVEVWMSKCGGNAHLFPYTRHLTIHDIFRQHDIDDYPDIISPPCTSYSTNQTVLKWCKWVWGDVSVEIC